MKRTFVAIPGRGVFAASYRDIKREIVRRLKTGDVESVDVQSLSGRHVNTLHYKDGNESKQFGATCDGDVVEGSDILWDPEFKVDNNGKVTKHGQFVGYAKLVHTQPRRRHYDYDKNRIRIGYGGVIQDLTETNGDEIAESLKK